MKVDRDRVRLERAGDHVLATGAAVLGGGLLVLVTWIIALRGWWTGSTSTFAFVCLLGSGTLVGALFVKLGFNSGAFRCLELNPDHVRAEAVAFGWRKSRRFAIDERTLARRRESWSREATYYVDFDHPSLPSHRFGVPLDEADSEFLVEFVNDYVRGFADRVDDPQPQPDK